MEGRGRHIAVEGLPAVGKSEVLASLARFYPRAVRVFPELVKSVVEADGIDLFRERGRLTRALFAAAPLRASEIARTVREGFLCLEESHLGVHLAYAHALGDRGFVEAFPDLEPRIPPPDLYVRLAVPVEESIARQAARATPEYAVDAARLTRFLSELDAWHAARRTPLVALDADRALSETVAELEGALGLAYAPSAPTAAATFDLLLLLGRPASGKSEFLDFLRRTPPRERAERFHVGTLAAADDFPILWRLFENDDVWERLGRPRLHSRRADGNYAVADDGVWAFLLDRLAAEVATRPASPGATLVLEFSRGGPSAYRDALHQLPPGVIQRAAALYLSVSFAESWRRNLARYDEKRRSGILTHSVPREEMERTYGSDDWDRLTEGRPHGTLDVRGLPVPFATLPNEPESTDPRVLGPRYASALAPLFRLWQERA